MTSVLLNHVHSQTRRRNRCTYSSLTHSLIKTHNPPTMPHSPLVDPSFFVQRWMKTYRTPTVTIRMSPRELRHGRPAHETKERVIQRLNVWSRIEQTDLAGKGSSSIRCPKALISAWVPSCPPTSSSQSLSFKMPTSPIEWFCTYCSRRSTTPWSTSLICKHDGRTSIRGSTTQFE